MQLSENGEILPRRHAQRREMEAKVTQPKDRIIRTEHSLIGLSVGDSFGERFFTNPVSVESYHRAACASVCPVEIH
jgi:hypothetical protein